MSTREHESLEAQIERLSADFASTALERDRAGGTAKRERDLLRQSDLLRLSLPRELGGLELGWPDTLSVVRRIARVDGSLAHLLAFHHLMLATVRLFGTPEQYTRLAGQTVEKRWFWGNALNPLDTRTHALEVPGGRNVNGAKSFCSGATDSDMLILSAREEGKPRLLIAAVPTASAGIRVLNDWDNMGQRQTDSGSVELENVFIPASDLLDTPGPLSTPFAALRPCLAQLILANLYLGIAEGALTEARSYTLGQSRAWYASGIERPEQDPYVLLHYGNLAVDLAGAAALTDAAGRSLESAWQRGESLTAPERGEVAVAIALAKVATTRAGLEVTNRLFEVTGARATASKAGLDRYWRNLRTHTLHDPVDYKLKDLGRWALTGEVPTPSFYS
ncbi:MAG: acyl-CoA dehydrogenase family protein [Polyangiaceae bacterium]